MLFDLLMLCLIVMLVLVLVAVNSVGHFGVVVFWYLCLLSLVRWCACLGCVDCCYCLLCWVGVDLLAVWYLCYVCL